MMAALTQDKRAADSLTEKGGKPKNMCEVLDRVEARGKALGKEEGRKEGRKEGREEGREEGRKEGREEGKKEGREEGRKEGMIKTLFSLVNDGILSASDAAKRADLTIEEFQKKAALYVSEK